MRTVTWPDERRRFATLAAFAAIAWLGMLVHNVVDLPTLMLLSTENSLPAVASAILVGTQRLSPDKPAVEVALLG